jgi:2-(3-amino-3-carboxypropyl)histidine synthase
MRTLFIPVKGKVDLEKLKGLKIKGKIGLVATIQYLEYLKEIKKILKSSIIGGQVLGCNVDSALKIKDKVDSYLYIGSGEFHPIGIALGTGKKVYVFNPNTDSFSEVDEKEIEKYKKRRKGAYLRFLNAKKIGILVSTKLGQYNLDSALKLKKKLKKESYIFIGDMIRTEDLENFPEIGCWINTACPRIEGRKIINYKDLKQKDYK